MTTTLQARFLRIIQLSPAPVAARELIGSGSDRYGAERVHAIQHLIDTGQVRLTWDVRGYSYLEAIR